MQNERLRRYIPFDTNFETILICAHRYAMGRWSYRPGVIDYTRPLLPYLSDSFLMTFLDSLAMQEPWGLGDSWDEKAWMDFQYGVELEQERREKQND